MYFVCLPVFCCYSHSSSLSDPSRCGIEQKPLGALAVQERACRPLKHHAASPLRGEKLGGDGGGKSRSLETSSEEELRQVLGSALSSRTSNFILS